MSPDQARALLAEPVKLEFSGRTVLNRFVKGAMTERMCTWSADDPGARGKPTPECKLRPALNCHGKRNS